MRAAIYVRVSTTGQSVENQLLELRQVAAQRGWEVVAEHRDEGISGARGRDARPGLDRLLRSAVRGQLDVVMAWSVDRLGRSLQDLVGMMVDLHSARVALYLHQQGLDTTTASGRAMFQMCGVFAEFERSMISERTKAGLARAKAKGKRLGRVPVTEQQPELEGRILALRAQGKGIHAIRKALGVGCSVVQRVLAAA
jgi:DNA invertase Pin-like site-specific DNA recombinase